ncbi:hypothetical protein [Natrarchaeobius oligotrophus]|uniref:hypothetical protein n=1 Tax=Natrarchaeobius oligotrophus TaxID=3455743 RepID=UPI00140553DD|nr:hypothetical protein [Natrarchaeobius chitinivorans]
MYADTPANAGRGECVDATCDNCESDDEIAYTLRTYVDGGSGEQVDLHFCSNDCLRVWT